MPFAASAFCSIWSAASKALNTSHFSPGAVTCPRTTRRSAASSFVIHPPLNTTCDQGRTEPLIWMDKSPVAKFSLSGVVLFYEQTNMDRV